MRVRRVLILDSDPTLSDLSAMTAENTGRYELRLENDPRNGLRTACEFRPHVIVLDIDMPGNAGADLALAFSRDSLLRHVPVLFLTRGVDGRSEGSERNDERGGKSFLVKPVDPVALLKAVDELIEIEYGQ
jgi:DNA-binding response OmpR family regulator